jgi:PadR family transcriptional regulator, regulatory protein PadR
VKICSIRESTTKRPMSNQKLNLGEFEELVLLAVLGLGDNAYGVSIRDLIEKETGRVISFGAIYTTLDRLKKKGYVSAKRGEPTKERGGRAKQYFKIEAVGETALTEAQRARNKMLRLANLKPGWQT